VRGILEEEKTSPGGVFVWVLLLIALFGPFALGILGAVLKSLNDSLGYSPVSQGGVIATLHWAPILAYVTWPIAGLVVVAAILVAIFKSISQRSNQK
jgi:hypothetical protein